MVVHASIFLFLGLIAVKVQQEVSESMEVDVSSIPADDEIFAETLGEQLDVPTGDLPPTDLPRDLDSSYSISDLPEVDDPLAAPTPTNEISPNGMSLFSDIDAPSIGLALSGRQEGRKEALLRAYGGTRTTQESVTLALSWLARQQDRSGLWSLTGKYANGAVTENQYAATAMALLAFLGDGHTHVSDTPFRSQVRRGMAALMKIQGPEGEFWNESISTHQRAYAHAQCTIAMCELYAMTQDSRVRESAQKAIDYCVRAQSPAGGWRYIPMQDADTSVTGWYVMALQSARMGGLDVSTDSLDRVPRFLDSASSHGGSRYSYRPEQADSPAMTAEALLCRQYLGWEHSDPRLQTGVEYLLQYPVNWQRPNVYYWYYATQVMHHMGGDPWVKWNKVMRQVIPENQIREGKERGSWDPRDDQWGSTAGRLYMTCLSTYMLEVYYRHLPLYSLSGGAVVKKNVD
jgi:hypothetical protein